MERGGKVKTKAVSKQDLAGDEMQALFMRFVDAKTSVLNTDEYAGYNSMNQVVLHRRVNHAREYTARDLFNGQYGVIHTNTIEGYWAIVKRAIYGQFHHVSPKYLPPYSGQALKCTIPKFFTRSTAL